MSDAPRFFSWAAVVRILAVLVFLLPMPAEDEMGGGDGGIINLPGTRDRNGNNLTGYRMRVTRDEMGSGIMLRMPQELRNSIALLRQGSAVVTTFVTDGFLVLTGESLNLLETSGVSRIDVVVQNDREESLSMTIELHAAGPGFTLTVW